MISYWLANKGIVCKNGTAGAETVIQGSVYAGLLDEYKTQANKDEKDGSDCVSVKIENNADL